MRGRVALQRHSCADAEMVGTSKTDWRDAAQRDDAAEADLSLRMDAVCADAQARGGEGWQARVGEAWRHVQEAWNREREVKMMASEAVAEAKVRWKSHAPSHL